MHLWSFFHPSFFFFKLVSCVVDLKNGRLHWISLAMNKLCYERKEKKIHISLTQLCIDLSPCINILFAVMINNHFYFICSGRSCLMCNMLLIGPQGSLSTKVDVTQHFGTFSTLVLHLIDLLGFDVDPNMIP